MNHFIQFGTVITAVICLLGSCDQSPTDSDDHIHSAIETNDEHDEDAHVIIDDHEDEGIIHLDAKELKEFGIRLAVAKGGVLHDEISLVGEIVINPDQVAHVVSRTDGIGMNIFRTIGDPVKVGETLAVLESPGLAESKATYISKAAQAALATTDLARAESIYTNTIHLLDVIANNPDVDTLREEITNLDIGANRSNLITTYAELHTAEAVYDREKTLYEQQITSKFEFLSAEGELKKAIALFESVRDDLTFSNRRELDAARRSKVVIEVSYQAALRQLLALGLLADEVLKVDREPLTELARYEIRAPISGIIIERHLVRGESVDAGDQVFVIADLSTVWGHLILYQRDLGVVKKGQVARVYASDNDIGTDVIIQYVSLILDTETRTTNARIVLDNKDGQWRPGMFIRAELTTVQHNARIVVPRSAIQIINQENVIFVETDEGLIPRIVRLGISDSNSFEIIDGLHIGERFVVAGGLALKSELNKAALEHAGHAH